MNITRELRSEILTKSFFCRSNRVFMRLCASKITAATIEKTSQPAQKPQKIVEKPMKSGGNLKNHLKTKLQDYTES